MKLSLLSSFVLLTSVMGCSSAPPKPITEAEAINQIRQVIAEAIDADSMGDTDYQSYYYKSLKSIEDKCSEPITSTLKMTINRADEIGALGNQFGWLNTLEETAYQLEGIQGPVQCAPIIAGVTL